MKSKKLKTDEASTLFELLAIAAEGELPMADALAILIHDSEFASPAHPVSRLEREIRSGASLSAAMQGMDDVFPSETVELVRVGEAQQRLPAILAALAGDYALRGRLRASVVGATAYPAAVICFLVAIVMVIMVFVVPTFKELFASFGADLPLPTMVLIEVSDFLVTYGLVIAAAAILFVVFGWRVPLVARLVDRLLIGLPVIGRSLKQDLFARIARPIADLLPLDVPLPAVVAHVRATTGSAALRAALGGLEQALGAGSRPEDALDRFPLLPARIKVFLDIGRRSGNVNVAFEQVARIAETIAIRNKPVLELTLFIVSMIVAGLIVAFTVVALYLPIFKVSGVV